MFVMCLLCYFRQEQEQEKEDVRIVLKEQRDFDRSLYSRKCVFWSMETVLHDIFSKKNPRDSSVASFVTKSSEKNTGYNLSLSPSFYQLAELEFSKGCLNPFAGFPKQILATSNFAIRNQKLQKESAVLRLARVVAVISNPDSSSSEHEAFLVMLTLEEAQSLRCGILSNPDKCSSHIQLVSPGGSHVVGSGKSNGSTKLIDILKMTRAIRAPCVTPSPASPLVYSLFQFVRLFNSDFYYTLADARFLLTKLDSFDGLWNLVDYTLKCRPRWSS
jgi:hypothetical protein